MKQKIIQALMSTNRGNMDKMVEYLENEGFFEAPASTKFHGNYEGGLAEHSWNVYQMLNKFCEMFNIDIPESSRIIAALLHDVCKINQYIYDPFTKNYKWNKSNDVGHANLSIERIKKHIELIEIEETMIRYHMGLYGSHEYNTESWQHSEYSLKEVMDVFHRNNKALIFYFADHFCAAFIEKTRLQKELEEKEQLSKD